MDLFAAAADDARARRGPLASRLRPVSLDDVVGQRHLLARGRPIRAMIDGGHLRSMILWGPPGTGKTTIARLLADATGAVFVALSATSATVKDLREVIADAERRLGANGRSTVCFIDEIHRFSKTQQDALLPAVEDGTLVLIGATTEHPGTQVNAALRSRAIVLRLDPLGVDELRDLAARGAALEHVNVPDDAVSLLVRASGGDARRLLTALDLAIGIARAEDRTDLEVADAATASGLPVPRHGADDHYDLLSALIKSMRGSDPDAAVHWLARLLTAGEDPRVVARRVVIAAAEDVGLADPMALVIAEAAAQATTHVGMPEVQLVLAEAVIHLALAPKSPSVSRAIWAAMGDVADGHLPEVPAHLRDANLVDSRRLGHGAGYRSPHDDPRGWVEQAYVPADAARPYYRPSQHGREPALEDRWRALRGEQPPPQEEGP